MKITLEVPPNLEEPLRERLERDGEEEARRSVEAPFASALLAMLTPAPPLFSDEEFAALADEMADHMGACTGNAAACLPDEALTRGGIYGDHP